MSSLRDLKLETGHVIPERFLNVRYSRSGGPGGQNVNKVASKVDLRLDLRGAKAAVDLGIVVRLRVRLKNRLDSEGQIQVRCTEYREQSRNLDAALSRMEQLLNDALRPVKVRRATKPSKASKRRRIENKKRKSEKKKNRSRNFDL